ncbi:MAG: hypothetical protein R3F46_09985 [bacterium]
MLRSLLLLLSCCLTLLAACAGSAGPGAGAASHDSAALPGLPMDRVASEPFESILAGSAFIDSTGPPRVTTVGDNAILQSNAFTNAWAIWQFPQAADPILEITAQLRIDPDNEGYIAIADYATGRWDMLAAADGSQTLGIEQARHVSPLGNVFIAMIARHSDKILADGFSVSTDRTGWHVFPVVTDGDVGRQCRIAGVDGKPAIISRRYISPTEAELVYAYSLTELGLYPDDWFSIAINDTAAGAATADLAVISGNPAVAFQDAGSRTLKYLRSSTVHGHAPANWATSIEVDDDFRAGEGLSLAEVDGRPAIAYQVAGSFNELRYAWSSTADGKDGADWDFRAIESGGNTGYYPQLAVIGGNPAIGYYDHGNDRVSFLRSTSPDGEGLVDWIQYVNLLEGSGNQLLSPVGLLLADGHPGLLHITTAGALGWLSCFTSTTGESKPDWDLKSTVNGTQNLQYTGAAAVVGGFPAAAWRDSDTDDVWYARSTVANGNEAPGDWPASLVFENDGDSNAFDIDMAVVAGRPVLCFYRNSIDATHDDLYYAVLLD